MTKHHFKTWKFSSLYNHPASAELDAWRTQQAHRVCLGQCCFDSSYGS